jgi:predicted ester cyclase
MYAYELKAMVLHLDEEAWNKGHVAVVDELCTPAFVNHDPCYPEVRSRADLKRHILDVRRTYPDFHVHHDDLIAEDDKVVVRWTLEGTQVEAAASLKLRPPCTHVSTTGITIYRCAENMLAECWWNWDLLGMLQQLGIVEVTEPVVAQ